MIKGHYQRHALKWRFLLVGGFNSLMGIMLFPLLCWIFLSLREHYQWTLVLSHVVCINLAYMMHKYIVFKTKGFSFSEFFRFTSFYNIVFSLNWLMLPWLVHGLQKNPALIQLIINLFIALGSYFWHRFISFKV